MGLAASHAAIAARMRGLTEISLGVLLVIGLLTRPAAFVAFLFLGSLWVLSGAYHGYTPTRCDSLASGRRT